MADMLRFGHDFNKDNMPVLYDFLASHDISFPSSASKPELVRICDRFSVDERMRNNEVELGYRLFGFDPAQTSVARLRQLLLQNDVNVPLVSKKAPLVQLFKDHVVYGLEKSVKRASTPRPGRELDRATDRFNTAIGSDDEDVVYVGPPRDTSAFRRRGQSKCRRRSVSFHDTDDSSKHEDFLIDQLSKTLVQMALGNRKQAAEVLRLTADLLITM